MKTEMYAFDGALYRRQDMVKLTFHVALSNLSKFIEFLPKGYTIDKQIKTFHGSSKAYMGKSITVTATAYYMCKLMVRLGWRENSEVRNHIHVNYHRFDNSKNKELPMVLIFSKEKGYYTQYRNVNVTYNSMFTKGKTLRHIVPVR